MQKVFTVEGEIEKALTTTKNTHFANNRNLIDSKRKSPRKPLIIATHEFKTARKEK